MSVLATKKLGDIGARRRCEIGGKPIDHLLLLCDRVTHDRHVDDDVSRHGVQKVLSSNERVCSDLTVIKPDLVSGTLSVLVTNQQADVTVVLSERTRVDTRTDARKSLRNGIDRDRLRIGESQDGLLVPLGTCDGGLRPQDCGLTFYPRINRGQLGSRDDFVTESCRRSRSRKDLQAYVDEPL